MLGDGARTLEQVNIDNENLRKQVESEIAKNMRLQIELQEKEEIILFQRNEIAMMRIEESRISQRLSSLRVSQTVSQELLDELDKLMQP